MVLRAGGVGRAGEVLAAMGGLEEFRRMTQWRISDVLPPLRHRIGIGSVTTQVPVQIRVPSHRQDS